jgi:cobalamin biosynthesis Mg chelatase CobN
MVAVTGSGAMSPPAKSVPAKPAKAPAGKPSTVLANGSEPSAAQRRAFAKMHWAMPDGSYYIRPGNASDLDNAIRAVGRATPPAGVSDVANRNAVRRFIIGRANAIGMSNKIPDTWNPDGSLKTTAAAHSSSQAFVDDYLEHFGRRGMKWGQHIYGKASSGAKSASTHVSGPRKISKSEPSADAAEAEALKAKLKKGGTRSLSNHELQAVVKRMNLEKQYSDLTARDTAGGKKAAQDLLVQVGKQQANALISKAATKGVEHLVNKVILKK